MLSSYLRASTIHGLAYLSKTNWWSRLLWALCILTSACTAAILILRNVHNWQSQPSVVTSVDYALVAVSINEMQDEVVQDLSLSKFFAKGKTLAPTSHDVSGPFQPRGHADKPPECQT